MLATINIHSAYKKLFAEKKYCIDLVTYADIISYLGSMHPKFAKYANDIYHNFIDEAYCLLDKDKKLITQDQLWIRKIKEDDEFYLVPVFAGGGGKNTKFLVLAAMAAMAVSTGGASLGMAPGAMGGATSAATAAQAAGGGFAGLKAGAAYAWGSLGAVGQTLAINAGLALATMLFTKRPKSNNQVDENARQNDMFGSLKNTTTSGTPIPLIYGQFRVAGQLISGFIDTTEHGKSANIRVSDKF